MSKVTYEVPLDNKCTCNASKLLYELYYCTDCEMLRCKECLVEETSCVYCPQCLFEVPTASIKTERGWYNRLIGSCGRNCFTCPVCVDQSLLVVNEGTIHYLYCVRCGWDSNESSITFERPTGLVAQLQKDSRPDALYFKELKDYYDRMSRHYKEPATGFSFTKSLQYGFMANKKEFPVFSSNIEFPSSKEVDDVDVSNWVSLEQSMRQVGYGHCVSSTKDLKPLRVPLRRKTTKKCRECLKVLVKPDNKAISTAFVEKSMAWDIVPRMELQSPLPHLRIDTECELLLQVMNPFNGFTTIEYGVIGEETIGCEAIMLGNKIELSPFKESWPSRDKTSSSILKCKVVPKQLNDVKVCLTN